MGHMNWTVAPAMQIALVIVGALLIICTIGGHILARRTPRFSDAPLRMRTWWFIAAPLCLALVGGWAPTVVLFAFISFFALREYVSLVPIRRNDRPLIPFLYLSIPITYWSIWTDGYGFFLVIVPVYAFLFIAFLLVLTDRTDGFLRTLGTFHWGLLLTVFALAHCAFIMRIPAQDAGPGGPAGLLFILILVTQLNDSFQYLWGKMMGKQALIPNISPNKTRAGLIGGALSATAVFMILAPYFTPFTLVQSALIGLSLPLIGFFWGCDHVRRKTRLGGKGFRKFIARTRWYSGPCRQPDVYRPLVFSLNGFLGC